MLRIAIIIITVLNLFTIAGFSQSIYQLSFQDINGDTISMNRYAGKKTMIILVPFNQQDTAYKQLTVFKARYADSIQIIGIVSHEDGFKAEQASVLSGIYRPIGLTLTKGMHTRKSAGNQQSPLMQWLTDNTKNHRYNTDAAGPGHKFFITETGILYAVMSPPSSLQSPIINRIVHSNPQ